MGKSREADENRFWEEETKSYVDFSSDTKVGI
jgi:hypothetical protein